MVIYLRITSQVFWNWCYVSVSRYVSTYFTEFVKRRGEFFLWYSFIFLPLGGSLESLPRQAAAIEVHEHVAQGLQVVAPRLFDAQVGIYRCIPRSTCDGNVIFNTHNFIWYFVVAIKCISFLVNINKGKLNISL